jgi:hypothetical protein
MQSVPDPVYAYDQEINDFRLFVTKQKWKDHITVSGAISYLKNHLQKSLKDDFYPAYEAYKPAWGGGVYKSRGGFFALPRIVFPYITFLGTLLGGGESSRNAIDYMHKYLSKVNQAYEDKELCYFIYWVYRHGLAHTNMPKVVSENGKVFGWRIVFDDKQHLSVDNAPGVSGKSATLSISPKKLANEVVSSIDEYVKDLQVKSELLDKFKEGFVSMATTSHYLDKGKNRKLIIPAYLKNNTD